MSKKSITTVVGAIFIGVLLGIGGVAHAESSNPLTEIADRVSADTDGPEVAQTLSGFDRVVHAAPPAAPVITLDENFNPTPAVAPGETQSVTLAAPDGGDRHYFIHVGSRYNPTQPEPMPVLFGFHGWKQSAEEFLEVSRFQQSPAWDEAIIIYPEGIDNAWDSAPYATGRPGKDLRFVEEIINRVDSDYLIDRHRIYASGFSNGGGMATSIACHMPETFAAFASVSGAYYRPVNWGCKSTPIASLIIHNVDDPVVSYRGGLHNRGRLLAAIEVSHQYAHRNGCDGQPPEVSDVGKAQRLVFHGCAMPTEHIRAYSGEHSWTVEPDATTHVWNFLSKQRR